MVQQRVRIRFRKQDDLRLISHRDLARVWERLLRRAAVRPVMSEGFHPRPRLSFPSALAVGVVGLDEVVEMELADTWQSDELLALLGPRCPDGLVINSIDTLPPLSRQAQVQRVAFEMPIPADRLDALSQRIDELLGADCHFIERDDGQKPIDLRALLEEVQLVDGVLRMQMRVTPKGSVRPREVLAALELEDLEQQGLYLSRTTVELEAGELSP
jgi:radical SAM-linked protein